MAKKDDKAGKDKKSKKGGGDGSPSVANHPRARAQVRRAKGWGGIVGFALAAYFSHKAQVPIEITGARALVAGVAGYVTGGFCAVTVWRHLVIAEVRAAAESGRLIAPSRSQGSGR
jgi:hypothetical protein